MPAVAFLGRGWIPIERARVSAEDRGFLYADGVYELIRVYGGRPFHLDDHLRRFLRSARALEIPVRAPLGWWRRLVLEGIRRGRMSEAKVYLQITRGAAPRELLPTRALKPTLFVSVRPFGDPYRGARARGVSAVSAADLRWGRCDIKAIALLPNVLAKRQAVRRGAFEALLVDPTGRIGEGSHTNVFALFAGGRLVTPPEGARTLGGVTRRTILRSAREAGFRVEERPLGLSEARRAREIFLTGTTTEVLPVVRLDGARVGDGRPGAVSRFLWDRYRDEVARLARRPTSGRKPGSAGRGARRPPTRSSGRTRRARR